MTPTVVFILYLLAGTEEQAIEEAAKAEEFLFGEEVVTISARREQPLSEAASAVTVLSRKDILASGAFTIVDLLRTIPGVNVIWINPSYPIVTIRGFNNKVLVLVDGREVTDSFFGITGWDFLSLGPEDIERIEVLRGGGSALYGVNAYAGVINIVTRSAERKDSRYAHGSVGWSSMQGVPETLQVPVSERHPSLGSASGAWSGAFSRGYYGASVHYMDRQDWYNYDAPSDESIGGRASGALDLGNAGSIQLDGGVTKSDLLFYQSEGGDVPARVLFGYSKANYQWKGLSLQAYWNHFELGASFNRDVIIRAVLPSIYANFNVLDGEAQYMFDWKEMFITTAGVDYRFMRYSSALFPENPFIEKRFGAFLQEEVKPVKNFILTLGGRFDRNTISFDSFSPRLAVTYTPKKEHSLRISWGQAYAKPNLLDVSNVNYFTTPVQISFPAGKVDNSRVTNFEFGYRYFAAKSLEAGWDAFFNRYWGALTYIYTTDYQYPREGISYDSYGIDASFTATPYEWLKSALTLGVVESYELQDSTFVPPDKRGFSIDRAPSFIAHWTIRVGSPETRWGPGSPSGGFTVHYIGQYLGSILDPDQPKIIPKTLFKNIGPTVLLDANVRYQWGRYEGGIIGRNVLNNIHREFPGVSNTNINHAVPGGTNYAGELVPREIIAYITVRL